MKGYYKQKLSNLAVSSSKKKGLKKISCKWQINMTSPKNLPLVIITLFKNIYYHDISIKTLKFTPIYKLFTFEIMKEIKFYVVNSCYNASIIWNFLQSKYPERVFLTQDLNNVIQKIKQDYNLQLEDTLSLLTKLLQLQSENSFWFVKPWINDTSNRLIRLF